MKHRKIYRTVLALASSILITGHLAQVKAVEATEPVPSQAMAQPQHHAKGVYVDQENRIFWPYENRVWIRIATSAEQDAPSFLLQEVKSGSEPSDVLKETEGIELEIPGNQFIRWVNHHTKDETLYRFFTDKNAPTNVMVFSGAPEYISQDHQYFGPGISGNIIAKDDLSGVKQTYLSIDGAEFKPLKDQITFTESKEYFLRYYSVDNVGHASEMRSIRFTIDSAAPTTSYSKHNNYIEDNLSIATKLFLTASDNKSGVKTIYYRIDDSETFLSYKDQGISVDHLADGEHTLHYYAMDQVENREPVMSYAFYIDHTPPDVAYQITGDLHKAKDTIFVSPRSQIELSASDARVDVKEIHYKLGDETLRRYETPISLQATEGKLALNYLALDTLNNFTDQKKSDLIVDAAEPKTQHRILGPAYSQGSENVYWITGKTKIALAASDDSSGVQKIEYQISDHPIQEYSGPITLTQEGRYLLKYWAVDNVNNREQKSPVLLVVDETPPSIIHANGTAILDETPDKTQVFDLNTPMLLAAHDVLSGVDTVYYSVNDGPIQQFKGMVLFKQVGEYKVKITAVDHVGNASSVLANITVVDNDQKNANTVISTLLP